MFASRLYWKICAASAVPALIAALSVGAVVSQRQHEWAAEQARRRLRDTALILREELGGSFVGSPTRDLQQSLTRLGAATGLRITLISADGTVLADSNDRPARLDNHLDRPEIRAALADPAGLGTSERISGTVKTPMLYVAVRIGDPHNPAGFVRTALQTSQLGSPFGSTQPLIWAAAGAGLLTAMGLSHFLAGRIVRPLRTVTAAAEAVAAGDVPQQVEVGAGREMGALAEAFNLMSREVAGRIELLQHQQAEWQQTSARLEAVLGAMIEGVIAIDERQRVVFANRAARRLLSFPSADIDGRPLWELCRIPAVQDVVADVLAGTAQRRAEIELPRRQAVVSLVATRLGHSRGAVLVLHDVTELRRLENMRREFVSNVSHELKTPLASIQAYTETLLEGAIDDPEHNRRFLQRIEEQADRLQALILDLLRLARIESGVDTWEVQPVDVQEVVAECIAAHDSAAETRGVVVETAPPEAPVWVTADEAGLRTILDNLLDNAIKYTPPGGRVTVRWSAQDDLAQIEVADTGVGIPEEHQARIFERFYRVDRARSRELGGTGLGLSIVKHLTQVFGGSVEVASRPGAGSRFTVRLQRATPVFTEIS